MITTQKDDIVLFKGKISNGILKGNISTKLARYEDHQNTKLLKISKNFYRHIGFIYV